MKTIILGAVAYDPKVVPIWDIIRDDFNANGVKLDYVLFSNYERQVDSLLKGHIDIAWNTNVAWIRTLYATKNSAKALAMRDTDIGFTTRFVAKKDSGISSINDLQGKLFGLGSMDSAQAAIMAIEALKQENIKFVESNSLNPARQSILSLVRHNSDVGKHGDTGRSEFDVLNRIRKGELDAGSIGSSTWARILQDGSYEDMQCFYTSKPYCHCNFSALQSLESSIQKDFCSMLLAQNDRKSEALISKMMEMEGLNKWVLCGKDELEGYTQLQHAMQEQKLLENK